jgi:hypothetical protein
MKLQTVVVHSVRRVVIGTIAVALVALAIQFQLTLLTTKIPLVPSCLLQI